MTAPTDLPEVLRAACFAAWKHQQQCRKNGPHTPYINHCIAAAEILARVGDIRDPEILQAALLHDTLEDTVTSADELAREFGPRIRDLVLEVSDDMSIHPDIRKGMQEAAAGGESEGARLLKLADKICNVSDMRYGPPEGWSVQRRRAYIDWARRIVDKLRGTNAALEAAFDNAYAATLRGLGDADDATSTQRDG